MSSHSYEARERCRGGHRPIEEGNGVFVLEQYCAEAIGGHVALDDEGRAKSGSASTDVVVMVVFRASKAIVAFVDHRNPSVSKRHCCSQGRTCDSSPQCGGSHRSRAPSEVKDSPT